MKRSEMTPEQLEHARLIDRNRYIRDREKRLEQSKQYNAKNREKISERNRQRYAKNREERCAKQREYYAKNKYGITKCTRCGEQFAKGSKHQTLCGKCRAVRRSVMHNGPAHSYVRTNDGGSVHQTNMTRVPLPLGGGGASSFLG